MTNISSTKSVGVAVSNDNSIDLSVDREYIDPKIRAFLSKLDEDDDGKLSKAEVAKAAAALFEEKEDHARTKRNMLLILAGLVVAVGVLFGVVLGAVESSKEVHVQNNLLTDGNGNEVATRQARHAVTGFTKAIDVNDAITVETLQSNDSGGRRLALQKREKVGDILCKEVTDAIERVDSGDLFATKSLKFVGNGSKSVVMNLELTVKEHWTSNEGFGFMDVTETSGSVGPFTVECKRADCDGKENGTCKVYSASLARNRRRILNDRRMKQEPNYAVVDIDYLRNAPVEELADRVAKVVAAAGIAATAAAAARAGYGKFFGKD
eukprot:g926.t1